MDTVSIYTILIHDETDSNNIQQFQSCPGEWPERGPTAGAAGQRHGAQAGGGEETEPVQAAVTSRIYFT